MVRSGIILNFWLSVSCLLFVVDNMQLDHLDPSFVYNEKWWRIGRTVRSQEQQEDNELDSWRFFYVLCFISSYISRAVQSHWSFLVVNLDLYTIQKICHFRENMNGFCGSNFWETDFSDTWFYFSEVSYGMSYESTLSHHLLRCRMLFCRFKGPVLIEDARRNCKDPKHLCLVW